MPTTEAPPALTAADAYLAALLAEDVPVLRALGTSFAAGVQAHQFHEDHARGQRRLGARRAVDLADEMRPRDVELRQQERSLVEVEQAAVAAAEEQLRAEYERKLAEAVEAARRPLVEFKAEHAAELASLDKISRAARDGANLLRQTADPKIDEAIERLQRAESGVWGAMAPAAGTINFAAMERRDQRERQIKELRAMKLRPECFQHAASNPWRSFDPGEVASGDASI